MRGLEMGANIDVLMLYAYETRKSEGFRGVRYV